MEIEKLYALYKLYYKVKTDTRSDLTNAIFFALKGANFNGNKYAIEALEKGAIYAIVDEEKYKTKEEIILVDNVLETLQSLAAYHRSQCKIPVIALTGSNGKTTTKELISAVLKTKYKCVATKGNLNNHIGVPLTLLSIKPNTEISVIEMGANHPNEIENLCEIAQPDFGYITNFGKVHLEGFGSLEGVIKAKTEMYNYLNQHNKIAFINTYDSIQISQSKNLKKISFGKEKSDYPIQFISANPFVHVKFENILVQTKLIGKYNYLNIATAIAVAQYFKVSNEMIKKGIENYIPSNNRSQIINKGSNKIILDAYNANPNSMQVALENISQLSDNHKIVVLGDMFEIGLNSLQEHQNVVNLINNSNLEKAYLIGESFAKCQVENKNVIQFKTFEEFKIQNPLLEIESSTILIKASRGMALEKVLDIL